MIDCYALTHLLKLFPIEHMSPRCSLHMTAWSTMYSLGGSGIYAMSRVRVGFESQGRIEFKPTGE
jgi:hypothetical protein